MVDLTEYNLDELLLNDFDGAWGEEAENGNGVSVLRSTDMRGGKLSFHSAARREIPPQVIKKKRLIDGDILVNKSSGSAHLVGASVIFFAPDDNDYLCSNFTRCLRPDQTRVDPEFLYFGLQSPQFHSQVFGAQRTTSGLRNLKISEFKAGTIPMPESLSEQRRIVVRIKECMERVEEIENNSTIIDDELAALFPAMLHEKFAELAKKVSVERLESVTEIKGGASLPRGSAQDKGKNAVLLVKVGDMNLPGNERIIQVSRAYVPTSKAGNKVIDSGAVIFPKRGGAIATNKKRMLGRPSMIDPNLMAIIAKTGRIISEYLYYWTQTLDLTDISNGGVIPQLNRKDLAPLEIPVPELKTQELIVSELEQAEAFCFEQRTLFDSANQERQVLRESILRRAFDGEL